MSHDDELRKLWLSIEAIVGDSEIELADLDDGNPVLSPHEPGEAALDKLAAEVGASAVTEQRADVYTLLRDAWQRARALKPMQSAASRAPLSPELTRVELLVMVQRLQTAHPQQFAQHYRNLDEMSDATLRALVEDMLALIDDSSDNSA